MHLFIAPSIPRFYFNASSDDWGSNDMIALHSTFKDHLNDTRESLAVDRQANNAYAKKTKPLLFLSRLLIFKYCFSVPNSRNTFTCARWTLLQMRPHVLFDQDILSIIFLQLRKLRHHTSVNLLDLVRDLYEDAKGCLIKHGCLPKIKDNTRSEGRNMKIIQILMGMEQGEIRWSGFEEAGLTLESYSCRTTTFFPFFDLMPKLCRTT